MSKRHTHLAIYEKAYGALTRPSDPRLETLKVDIVAGRYALHSTALPNELDEIAGERGWGLQVMEELLLGGFLEYGPHANRFTRRDRVKVEEQLDSLAAMESVCLIRMTYTDLKHVRESIWRHQEAVQISLQSADKVDFAIAAQRLLLTIVAAIARENLLQRYTILGLPTLAYAWARELSDVPGQVIAEAYDRFSTSFSNQDYVAAALDIAALRRLRQHA
ncbi:hypothetical protein [Sphingobium sp. Ant17]|uniref:hypothetical protein n=1 Tax=Sphingobium sp. Ant17 TaxID=1461752 RepID=UPI00044EEE8F|nr:hypothetical protein [Sphingobium sp. Ant17]EXS71205.1 hypothetical protein BF95_02340 [Sphingobium sp. Ant17]